VQCSAVQCSAVQCTHCGTWYINVRLCPRVLKVATCQYLYRHHPTERIQILDELLSRTRILSISIKPSQYNLSRCRRHNNSTALQTAARMLSQQTNTHIDIIATFLTFLTVSCFADPQMHYPLWASGVTPPPRPTWSGTNTIGSF
jgi:hypothetical protein